MDISTAKKINKSLVDYYLHEVSHECVPDGPPPDYSLEDMLEATKIMEGHSEPGETTGSRTSYMTCAKRLVAAMYVLKNYHTADIDELTDVVIAGDGKALLCLRQRDLLRLSSVWEKHDRGEDCYTCGKVDPDELPESRAVELLRRSIDLVSLMSTAHDDASLPEKIEDFLEDVHKVFPKFVWRKAGAAYWAGTDSETFQPKDEWWQPL